MKHSWTILAGATAIAGTFCLSAAAADALGRSEARTDVSDLECQAEEIVRSTVFQFPLTAYINAKAVATPEAAVSRVQTAAADSRARRHFEDKRYERVRQKNDQVHFVGRDERGRARVAVVVRQAIPNGGWLAVADYACTSAPLIGGPGPGGDDLE